MYNFSLGYESEVNIMKNESIELKVETEKLQNTRTWIKEELENVSSSEDELKNKISSLKKASKGGYNEELETSIKLYEIVHKSLEKYKEAISQPYFARIDFREFRKERESYYIGKFGLGDSKTGEEVVIDWRAPIADLYYSGTQGETYYVAPIGAINGELSLKRKFLYKNNELKDIFDEGINDIIIRAFGDDNEGNALIDEFLRINLEESTGSKLKEVVATIQKEQNDIIRAEKNMPIIVQGSAGSGKTTIALHRLAYLLYRYKSKLSGEDILVIAPNKLFLDYISEVLPNLGVEKVKQVTFEDMCLEVLGIKSKVYTKDKKLADILESNDEAYVKYVTNSSKVKGSVVFRTILDRYLKIIEREDSKIEDIKVQDYVLFESKEVKRLYLKDLSNMPINKRKDEIKRYLGLKLNEKIVSILERIDFLYEYNIARIKKTMEDGAERRNKLIEIYNERDEKKNEIKLQSRKSFENYFETWKGIDTKGLYLRLFNEEDIFEEATANKIPWSLATYMKKMINEDNEKGIIDSDDLTAMLYIKFNIDGVSEKFKYSHIVIDEVQDYSLLQLMVARFMVYGDSFTIVGDIGQGIYYYKGIEDWSKVIAEVFNNEVNYAPLGQSYRSTIEIIEFANVVLKKQKNSLGPAKPVLRHGKKPEVINFSKGKEFADKLDEIVQEVKALGKNSVAVIGRTHKECKKINEVLKKYSNNNWKLVKENDDILNLDKIIIPSYMTKGLEFDCSVIYNCNSENYEDNELDKKLLYVVLTRALHLEYVFYNGDISPLI